MENPHYKSRRKISKEPANESLGFDVIPAPLYWKLLLKRQHKLQKHSKNANRKQSWSTERPEDQKAKFAESKCDAYHQWNYMNKFTVDSQIWMCIWLIQSWFYPDACGVMQNNSTFLIASFANSIDCTLYRFCIHWLCSFSLYVLIAYSIFFLICVCMSLICCWFCLLSRNYQEKHFTITSDVCNVWMWVIKKLDFSCRSNSRAHQGHQLILNAIKAALEKHLC